MCTHGSVKVLLVMALPAAAEVALAEALSSSASAEASALEPSGT